MKKNNLFTSLSLGLFVAAATVIGFSTPSFAQAGTGQALEIAPPVISLTADPGQTITTNISLRDISSGDLLVTNEVNDFVAGGEDGTPRVILDEDSSNPYSLKSWITTIPQILLKPKEIKSIKVTISVPANASPGGYFGVIRFTGTPPELEGTGVSLSASLGSLILIKINGDAKEQLAIEDFYVANGDSKGSLFEATPLNFVERIKNTGNIQEQPAGLVTIKDMFGNVVATLPVNQPPRDILPDSIRKFEQPLDSSVIGNRILFGYYTASLDVTYGAEKQTLTSSTSFWIIPYKLIGLVIVLLIVGFLGLRFAIRRYNRHIIAKAKSSKPTKKR